MSWLYKEKPKSLYIDRFWKGTREEFYAALDVTSTVYVGNLSFSTREEQIWELFSRVGEIRRIIMGLDREKKTPCGFCFVEYYTHKDAVDCVNFLNRTKLDNRVIRTDLDPGFREGRQYGRGKSGGQVRDEYRDYYDPDRGGFGKLVFKNLKGESTMESGRRLKRSYEKWEFEGKRRTKEDTEYPLKRIHTDNDTQERDNDSGRGDNDDSEKNPRFREEHSGDET